MPSLAKNTAFMTIASIAQKATAFVYFSLVARALGPARTGTYVFALSFTTIFVVFVDLGLVNVFVRESAKQKEKLQEYLSTILGIKCVLAIATHMGMWAYLWWIDPVLYGSRLPESTVTLIAISGVTMLFDSLNLTLYGAMRALGDLRYESFGMIASQCVTLILGGIFLFLHVPLWSLMVAFLVPSMANTVYIGTVVRRAHGLQILPRWPRSLIVRMLTLAAPFALAAIFARVYGYSDSILLGRLVGEQALGWYSIPYKITFAFQFIPLSLIAGLYPAMSAAYATQKVALGPMLEKSMIYLWFVACPVAFGIIALAPEIVLHIYTRSFSTSIAPLRILIASLLFSFVSFPLGALLNACDRQKTQTAIVGCVMVGNIALNLLLIPRYGAIGAAISALLGNAALAIIGYLVAMRVTSIDHGALFFRCSRILAASLVMGSIVWYMKRYMSFPFTILVGIPSYIALLILTRAYPWSEILALKRSTHITL